MVLLQIESCTFPPNIIKIGQHLTLLLLKGKGCHFLKHSVVVMCMIDEFCHSLVVSLLTCSQLSLKYSQSCWWMIIYWVIWWLMCH